MHCTLMAVWCDDSVNQIAAFALVYKERSTKKQENMIFSPVKSHIQFIYILDQLAI